MTNPDVNQLLAALPETDRERLRPNLRLVYLSHGSVLREVGDRLRHIHFPTDCVVCLMRVLNSGRSAGVALVGNDGAVGIELLLGADNTTERAVVQRAGFAFRLRRSQARQEFARHGAFAQSMLRYIQDLLVQVSQVAACYRNHSVDQQFCSWLLRSLQRQPSNELTITQDTIADVLGVRRESVTAAARRLQNEGAIRCGRGHIVVLDRLRLEQLSCECGRYAKPQTNRARPQTRAIRRRRAKPVFLKSKSDELGRADSPA